MSLQKLSGRQRFSFTGKVTGRHLLVSLVDTFGVDTVSRAVDELIADALEQKMAEAEVLEVQVVEKAKGKNGKAKGKKDVV